MRQSCYEKSETRRIGRWFTFGVVLGVTSLVRGVAFPFLAVPAAVWLICQGVRVSAMRTSVAALGLLLVVLPWTARNAMVMGYPSLISTDAAAALFNAHNPLAFGSEKIEMSVLGEREWPSVQRLPLRQREVARAKAEVDFAIRYIVSHPWEEVPLIPWRIYYLYAGDHYPLRSETPQRPILHRIAVVGADAFFLIVLLLALIGVPETLTAEDSRLILPLTIVYFTILHGVLFFGAPRYHAPLSPVLSILAPVGAGRVMGAALRGRLDKANPRSKPY